MEPKAIANVYVAKGMTDAHRRLRVITAASLGCNRIQCPTGMALSPGTRVGQYEVAAPIGAGGMGEVYRARDRKLGRDVAIKALPSALAGDPDRLTRLEQEARILARLNHPHIGTIYGLEQSGAASYLVLELIDGETLDERLARTGPIASEEALRIASQIADALEAANVKGITHRDIKPSNIKSQIGVGGMAARPQASSLSAHFASGSGRSWKCTALLVWPLPPS